MNAFIGELVVIHDVSLPLMLPLANLNAPPEVVNDSAQVLDQLRLLVVNHGDQLLVIRLAAAWRVR